MRVMQKTIVLTTPLPERASFAEKRRAADLLDAWTDEFVGETEANRQIDVTRGEAKPATIPDPPGTPLAPLDGQTIVARMGEIGRQVAGGEG